MTYLRIGIIAAVAAFTNPVFAGQGDTLTVGTVAAPANKGQLNSLTASFVDEESGNKYGFFLEAKQDATGPGPSPATFALEGPHLHGCTMRRSSTQPQPQINPSSTSFDYWGSYPYESAPCGTANNQAITISNCVANIQAHGFIHADEPFVTYLGPTTIEVQYQKAEGRANDEIDIKIYTPRKVIKLSGKVTVMNGTSIMPNCR